MTEKTYFFAISIPRDEIIEYSTKLNSYISKLFDKQHACTLKPLEVREDNVIAKIIIKTSEEKIKIFADRFFQKNYEFTKRDNDEVEITQKEPNLTNTDQNQGLKH